MLLYSRLSRIFTFFFILDLHWFLINVLLYNLSHLFNEYRHLFSENDDGIRAISSTGSSFSNRSMFTCENGEVISQLAVCDSYHDCFDISDEKYCGEFFFSDSN